MRIKKILSLSLAGLMCLSITAFNVDAAKKAPANKKKVVRKVAPNQGNSTFTEAIVTRVIDGDTLHVTVNKKKYKLRMVGVDTPETVHPKKPVEFYGKEASNYTKAQLTNKKVYLQKDVTDTDKYGRLLRYVWLSKPSNNPTKQEVMTKMFNAQLVKNGYANVYTYPPDVKYIPIFRELEQQARKNNVGLWNPQLAANFDSSGAQKNTVATAKATDKNTSTNTQVVENTTTESKVIVKGHRKSKIYHMPGDQSYNKISKKNLVIFNSPQEAEAAGYRRAKR